MKLAICLFFSLHTYAVNAYNYASQGADWATSGSSSYVESCVGTRQSPIDFKREETIAVSGVDPLDFSSYCGKIAGKLKNNGNTLMFSTLDGKPSPGHVISGGPLGNSLYHFLQFHFHWGSLTTRGSEHLVDGERLPAELHLVHVKEDYVTDSGVDPAAYIARDGLAVLGIFLIGGGVDDNDSSLFNNWFNVIASGAKDIANGASQVRAKINLNLIVKRINPTFAEGFNYWHYEGGLTTPDCNEAVQFMITERPLQISDSQMSTFFDLLDSSGDPLTNNYREVQETNCRKISYVYYNVETTYQYKPCTSGYFSPDPTYDCQDCGCYLTGTNGDSTCDSDSSCTCTIGYMGSKCYYCDNGFYRSDSGFECIDCACLDGSLICDSNGICTCTTGFSGDKCNECASDFTGSACDECVSGLFMVQGICSAESTEACSTPNFYGEDCMTDCGSCDEITIGGVTMGFSKFNGNYELQGTLNHRPWYQTANGDYTLAFCNGNWLLIDTELFPNNCEVNLLLGESESIYYPNDKLICIQDWAVSGAPVLGVKIVNGKLFATEQDETANFSLDCVNVSK